MSKQMNSNMKQITHWMRRRESWPQFWREQIGILSFYRNVPSARHPIFHGSFWIRPFEGTHQCNIQFVIFRNKQIRFRISLRQAISIGILKDCKWWVPRMPHSAREDLPTIDTFWSFCRTSNWISADQRIVCPHWSSIFPSWSMEWGEINRFWLQYPTDVSLCWVPMIPLRIDWLYRAHRRQHMYSQFSAFKGICA